LNAISFSFFRARVLPQDACIAVLLVPFDIQFLAIFCSPNLSGECRLQAEINQDATGVAVMQDAIENESWRVTGLKVIDNPLKSSH